MKKFILLIALSALLCSAPGHASGKRGARPALWQLRKVAPIFPETRAKEREKTLAKKREEKAAADKKARQEVRDKAAEEEAALSEAHWRKKEKKEAAAAVNPAEAAAAREKVAAEKEEQKKAREAKEAEKAAQTKKFREDEVKRKAEQKVIQDKEEAERKAKKEELKVVRDKAAAELKEVREKEAEIKAAQKVIRDKEETERRAKKEELKVVRDKAAAEREAAAAARKVVRDKEEAKKAEEKEALKVALKVALKEAREKEAAEKAAAEKAAALRAVWEEVEAETRAAALRAVWEEVEAPATKALPKVAAPKAAAPKAAAPKAAERSEQAQWEQAKKESGKAYAQERTEYSRYMTIHLLHTAEKTLPVAQLDDAKKRWGDAKKRWGDAKKRWYDTIKRWYAAEISETALWFTGFTPKELQTKLGQLVADIERDWSRVEWVKRPQGLCFIRFDAEGRRREEGLVRVDDPDEAIQMIPKGKRAAQGTLIKCDFKVIPGENIIEVVDAWERDVIRDVGERDEIRERGTIEWTSRPAELVGTRISKAGERSVASISLLVDDSGAALQMIQARKGAAPKAAAPPLEEALAAQAAEKAKRLAQAQLEQAMAKKTQAHAESEYQTLLGAPAAEGRSSVLDDARKRWCAAQEEEATRAEALRALWEAKAAATPAAEGPAAADEKIVRKEAKELEQAQAQMEQVEAKKKQALAEWQILEAQAAEEGLVPLVPLGAQVEVARNKLRAAQEEEATRAEALRALWEAKAAEPKAAEPKSAAPEGDGYYDL